MPKVLTPPKAEAAQISSVEVRQAPYTVDELKALASTTAIQSGLNPSHFVRTIGCETANTWNPSIQSSSYNAKDPGHREDSWGLAMIHLPDHPEVSEASATDPVFAIKFMADGWEKNHEGQWTCYRLLQAKDWQ